MGKQAKIPLHSVDKVLFGMGLSLSVAAVTYTGVIYGDLPNQIPTHFDLAGNADSWGSKSSIWIGGIIMVVTNLAIILVAVFNTKAKNSGKELSVKGNARIVQYERRMIAIISLCIGVISWDLVLSMSRKLTGNALSIAAVAIILVVVFGYSVVMLRIQRKDPGPGESTGPFK